MRGVILLGLLYLLVACTGCPGNGTTGMIVFQSNRDGNFEIYTMHADGSNQFRITNSPSNDVSPSWSPDGSMIVFASDRDKNWEIYTVHPDGSSLTRLTSGPGANTAPSWALGGTRIIFVSSRDAVNGDVYMMNSDGTNVERLTNDAAVKDSPVMTPDGSHLIMTVVAEGMYAIAEYSANGTEHRLLTPTTCNSLKPSISPDGTHLVFVSDRDGGSVEIFTMTVTGENQTRITNNEYDDDSPAWTSTPGQILYSKRGGIYLRMPDGKSEKMLSTKGDRAPHWSAH